MTRFHAAIAWSWVASISRAIQLGESDAAFRLSVGLMRRLRELGAIS